MKVDIAGAGAIGLLFGARLADTGFDVRMITRSHEQAEAIRKDGIFLTEPDGSGHARAVRATENPEAIGDGDLTILTMKSYDLPGFMDRICGLPGDAPLLFIQNGISHLKYSERLNGRPAAFGTVEHGARRTGFSSVTHTGTGPLRISVKGNNDQSSFSMLSRSDSGMFPVLFEDREPEDLLLVKAIKNSLINPVTAITGMKNGELVENPHLRVLLKQLHSELMAAFPGMEAEVPLADVFDLCLKTAGNESSMLADMKSGRRTEAEAIMGGVIRIAEERGEVLPALTAMTEIILSMEGGEVESG